MTKKNKYLLTETLIKTLIVYFKILLIATVLRLGFEFLDPFEMFVDRVKDEYNEMLYDVMDGVRSTTAPEQSKDIFIVNVDTASRATLAKMITKVDQCKPKVIALDVMFDDSTVMRSADLERVLANVSDKLVSSAFLDTREGKPVYEKEEAERSQKILKRSDSSYIYGTEAFVNFVSEPENEHIRYFQPFIRNKADSITINAFPVEIIKKFAPDQFNRYKKKHEKINGRDPEIIVYQRDASGYPIYQMNDILNEGLTFDEFEGKIVLFGYIGHRDDLHESPFEGANGSEAEMNGVIVHANIVEMLLRDETVYLLGNRWTGVLSAVLAIILIFGLIKLHHRMHEHSSHFFEKGKRWSYSAALANGPSGIRNYLRLGVLVKGLAPFFSFPHFISFICLSVFFVLQVVLLHRFLIKINTLLIAAVIVLAIKAAETSSDDFMFLVHRISDGFSRKSRKTKTSKP
jgi:hypothetical protein